MPRNSGRVNRGRAGGGNDDGLSPSPAGVGTTGRYLVLLRDGDDATAGVKMLSDKVGLKMARSSDFKAGAASARVAGAGGIVFDEIGVAVVDADPEQYRSLAFAESSDSAVAVVEPERIVYALEVNGSPNRSGELGEPPVFFPIAPPIAPIQVLPSAPVALDGAPGLGLSEDYLEGLRDGIDVLLRKVRGVGQEDARTLRESIIGARAISEATATWGLQLTRVTRSQSGGLGVRVAVLDTGFDTGHPDFAGRAIMTESFIPNQPVQDVNGHGTHCIGTSCGPQNPSVLPRYGIAFGAEIFAGKVLSDQGSGGDGGILAGINWAVSKRCRVISMSLGAPVQPGQTFSRIYETAAGRALAKGSLIVAAAGNESHRQEGQISPVGHPANCPSIMAVAAVDSNLQVSFFSCGGINGNGGQVDIAGPGMNVYSTAPMPTRYRRLSGTSMATPHVAGIAALYAQLHPRATASDLWRLLIQNARRLPAPASDVGAGLVQAP